MNQLESFLSRCHLLAEKSGLSISTISWRLFNDGSRVGEVIAGKDIGIRRLLKSLPRLGELERQYGIEPLQAAIAPPQPGLQADPSAVDDAKPETADGSRLSDGDRGNCVLISDLIAGAG